MQSIGIQTQRLFCSTIRPRVWWHAPCVRAKVMEVYSAVEGAGVTLQEVIYHEHRPEETWRVQLVPVGAREFPGICYNYASLPLVRNAHGGRGAE